MSDVVGKLLALKVYEYQDSSQHFIAFGIQLIHMHIARMKLKWIFTTMNTQFPFPREVDKTFWPGCLTVRDMLQRSIAWKCQ